MIYLRVRKVVNVVYIDFPKAFDSVSRGKRLGKLESYGINGKALVWIRAFLSGCTQTVTVHIGNSSSPPVKVLSCVPQGIVLGPTLFLLFINEIVECLDPIKVSPKLYADDIKLYTEFTTDQELNDLDLALSRFVQCDQAWQLPIAEKKCRPTVQQLSTSFKSAPVANYVHTYRLYTIPYHKSRLLFSKHI